MSFPESSVYFGVVLTLFTYGIGCFLKKKTRCALVNPAVVSIVLVILVLLISGTSFEVYNESAKYITYFLTPATVSLALPLYERLSVLKRYRKAIPAGILSGVISAMGSVWAICKVWGLSHEEYVTLLPKSVTSAIGIGISEDLGGIPALTVAVITLTGMLGGTLAPMLCRLFRLTDPVAVGVAIGTSSHGLGTAKAMEIGETEGAVSSLSLTVCGLLTVIAAPLCAGLL